MVRTSKPSPHGRSATTALSVRTGAAIATGSPWMKRFVEGDPFRLNGVVSSWTIKEWHDPYLPALLRDQRGRSAG